MTTLIEAEPPASWQGLEERVAQILGECGYDVEIHKNVPLARGDASIDVWAVEHTSPPNVFAFECKHWTTPATKTVVHGFRTVVGDSGANTGFVISSGGFQKGAIAAACYSNVRLLDWIELQAMFAERWFQRYMAPRLREEADPLIEYTEPINARIFRKADALTIERREAFKALRDKHFVLAMAFAPMFLAFPGKWEKPVPPELPLRAASLGECTSDLPELVLDAPALRPLLIALTESYRAAIAEFDEVFGERA